MSWLFSRVLVEEFLDHTSSDGVPFAPLNVMPTLRPFWRKDKMMTLSNHSLFGLTLKLLTEDRGRELLTWFLAGFPVRISAQREKVKESPGKSPGCGSIWRELSVRYDLASSSWRTHRCLWDEALTLSSLTLPRWGMMQNGVAYRVDRIRAIGNGQVPGVVRLAWNSIMENICAAR